MAGSRWRAVTHPSTIAAIGLLALNDHVLKDRWPGFVTGKLSDLAGLYCFPILLAAVLSHVRVRRPGSVAFAATAAAFVLIKTWEPARALAELVLDRFIGQSSIRRDWTDLVALGAMVPAWRRWNCEEQEGPATWWRRSAYACVLVVGLSASAATSWDFPGRSVEGVEGRGGAVVALSDIGTVTAVSIDGGRVWEELELNDPGPSGERVRMERQLCLTSDPSVCLRLLQGEGVQERRAGGEWVWVFRLPPEAGIGQREIQADDGYSFHDLDNTFLGMVEGNPEGGRTVVVAMGTEGALVREPDGRWHQVAVADARPVQDAVTREQNRWIRTWLFQVPVSYTHLTLPTNREV